ncbi:hypothetical protein [Haloferula sp.]|uniref:hypothetical protein n=1 Tax=Haloferula sp. TaxID=2497595 RepID=UPI00329FAF01
MKQITQGNPKGVLDLDDCESTKTWASEIYERVAADNMPPGEPWPSEWKKNFATWMVEDCPCDDE